MTTGIALDGKPYAGNLHIRFDEGEVASAAMPRRWSLLYKRLLVIAVTAVSIGTASVAYAYDDDLEWKFDTSGSTPVTPVSTEQFALAEPLAVCGWGFGADVVGALETRPFSFWFDVFGVHFVPLGFTMSIK